MSSIHNIFINRKKKCTKTVKPIMKNRKNAGISIAEVVVAMAVIAVVSAAAIVAIQKSSVSMVKDMSAVEARTDASNNLEFFKFSDNLAVIQAKILSNSSGELESDELLESGNRILTDKSTIGIYTLKTEIEYIPYYLDEEHQNVHYGMSTPLSIRSYSVDQDGNVLFDVGCDK